MHPNYVLMRLPTASQERFQLILPFTPEGRQNMTSWMAANSDPDGYGTITAFTFPTNRNIDGPTQVFSRINQDSDFSSFRTLQGQQGSQVIFGDLLVIPIGNTLIYVAPAYVRSEQQQQQSIPELKRVVVVNGQEVSLGETLDAALSASVGQPGPPATNGGGTGPPSGSGTAPGTGGATTATVADLLNQALNHFTKADAALRTGDLAGYQSELSAAQKAVQQANEVASGPTTTAPSTTAPAASAGTPASTSASGSSTAGGTTATTASGTRTSTAGAPATTGRST
jgi:uncharacterized membrane protein (UPF0182 family)